jgi:serine/threonine protein kinase
MDLHHLHVHNEYPTLKGLFGRQKSLSDRLHCRRFESDRKECEDFVDLLYGLLQVNPNDRLTAEEALQHRFFKNNEQAVRSNFKPFRERHEARIIVRSSRA